MYLLIDRRVIFSKFFLVGIYCPFDMTYYPFDRQSCQITLVNKGNAGENVQLIEDSIAYLGPESMVMYYIEKPIFVPSENNSIIVKINLGRRLLNVMTSTFLPTIIIVMVCIYICKIVLYTYGPPDHLSL